jgi:hypothetical protein
MIAPLTEEAEAIGWYEQRMALEPDAQAKATMANAQGEELKHFGTSSSCCVARRWRIASDDPLHRGRHRRKRREAEDAENR